MPDGNVCCIPDCPFECDAQRLPERVPHAGKFYCIFHAPADLKRSWDGPAVTGFGQKLNEFIRFTDIREFAGITIPANASLSLDGTGHDDQLEFRNCEFLGAVKFSQQQEVYRNFVITDSIFADLCNFNFVGYVARIAFINCRVAGNFAIGSRTNRTTRNVDIIDLTGSKFSSGFVLSGFDIKNSLILESVHITRPPDFRDCVIPQDSRFSGFKCSKTAYAKIAEPSFRTIRQQLANTDARDFEGMFYCFEQRCARKRYPKISMRRMVSALYDFSTEYGTNYVRAVAIVLGVQIVFWALYLRLNDLGASMSDWSLVTRFAAAQLFRPFEIYSLASAQESAVNSLFGIGWPSITARILAGLQTVFSLVALTLFLLALRWRFRRTVT